jgi:hypothetical protein
LRTLAVWLTHLEGRMPPVREAPIWEPQFVERIVAAGFDAHEAVLTKSGGDNVLALKAMTIWMSAYGERLKAGDETPVMELATYSDTYPILEDDDGEPMGLAELGPEAAAALDLLIEDAQTHPFEAADLEWMETTTRAHEASRMRSQTAPTPKPLE